MADVKYTPGDYYIRCQRTGFKVLRSQARREWNGLLVREESFEARQPQDFVQGRPDHQAADDGTSDIDPYFLGANEVTADSL